MVLDKEVPLIRLFPKIINRSVFVKKHPRINPEIHRPKIVSYWREEKRRCIEGYWGKEAEEHWRWMNPDLYFFTNHWTITHVERGKPERTIRPYLRTVDWYFFSMWTLCRGFSGFKDDEEYSGFYLLKKYWQEKNGEKDERGDDIKLDNLEIIELNRCEHVKNSKGEYKKYKDPFKILTSHYKVPMGLPVYENPQKDIMVLSARSVGKSFWSSALMGREFTFNGARYMEDERYKSINSDKTTRDSGKCFGGSFQERHVNLLYDKVFSGLDNFEGRYQTLEREYPPPFYKHRVGTFTSGEGVVRHRYRIKYKMGGWRDKGSGSTFYMGVYSGDINKATGNRVNISVVDEVGLIQNIKEVHAANRYVHERGGVKSGSVLYIGTAGDITKIDGTKSLFYNPAQNGLMSFENKWEDSPNISMFIPAEYSLLEFLDENGNTKLEEAREAILKRREELAQGTDMSGFTHERMSMPIKPSDMFLLDGDLVFNQEKVMRRLSELYSTEEWKDKATFGQIQCFGDQFEDVHIKRGSLEEMRPILTRSITDSQDTRGCIIFYREPTGEEEFKKVGSRFRITYDPVRADGAHLTEYRSLASILVWDTKENNLAAEFIGRRETPEEVHDICLNLAIYYNCPVLFENNVPGFKNAALRRGLGYMLYPTPIKALSTKMSGLRYREGDVGVEVTGKTKPAMIEFSQALANKRDKQGLTVYEKLNSLRLLEEMEVWDGKNNSDHISSFLMVATWEEQEKGNQFMHSPNVESQYQEFKDLMKRGKYNQNLIRSIYN